MWPPFFVFLIHCKIRKVKFFKVDGGCGLRFWTSQRLSMSETETVYVRDRDCLCPRQKLFISQTENVYVRDRECLCPRQRMSMSETESFYVRDRECLCPRQRMSMSGTESVYVRDTEFFRDTHRVFPGHKLTSKSSPYLFPASIRIKMMREIRW